MGRPFADAVHVLLEVSAKVLKHEVEAGLAVFLQVLDAVQPSQIAALKVSTVNSLRIGTL